MADEETNGNDIIQPENEETNSDDIIQPEIVQSITNAKSAVESIKEIQSKLEETSRATEASQKKAEESINEIQSKVEETSRATEVSQKKAEKSAEHTKTSLNEVQALLEQVKTARDESLSTLEKTKTDSAQTAEIARTADEKDKKVKEYQSQLNELNNKFENLHSDLQKLLPAATGVGLAKSFNSRKEALKPSLILYISLFLFSIAGFIGFGIWALLSGDIHDIKDFIVFALERTPIIVGLVLLEEFSRRQFHSTTKLEEDYAYKETISIAFDGYQKAMSEIDKTPDTLASSLSKNVLDTLNQRPGRLIEADKQHELSANQILEAMTPTSDSSEKLQAITQIFKEMQKGLKASWIKYVGIIVISLGIGIAISYYYFSNTKPAVETHKIENSSK